MSKNPRTWDALLETPLADKAQAQMDSQPGLLFHVWDHPKNLVWHAKHTFEFPFDLALGKAVVAHDVIYDALPNKELRSAQWLLANDTQGPTTYKAFEHIMKTADHRVTDDNRMVLLDLANFMFPKATHEDFYKVFMESVNLYKVSPAVVIDAASEHLSKMHDNYADNHLSGLPVMERIAFVAIRTGIERALMLYEEAKGGAKRA